MKLPRHIQKQQSVRPGRASTAGGTLRSLMASTAIHLFVIFAVSLPAATAGLAPGATQRSRVVAFSGGGHVVPRAVIYSESGEPASSVQDTLVEPEEFEPLELAEADNPDEAFVEDRPAPIFETDERLAKLLSTVRLVRPEEVAVEEFSLPVAALEREAEAAPESIREPEAQPADLDAQDASTEEATDSSSGSDEQPARVASGFPPAYPRLALRMGWEGSVLCEVEVDAQGKVLAVKVIESSGYEVLDLAAVEALEDWTFEPGSRAGLAVASKLEHRIRFRLND